MINFSELLENTIKKEIEKRKSRESSGKFSPSRMGRCLRFQYWQKMREPESDPIPMAVYKKFRAGNIYHQDLQSLVENTEVKFENENFIMFADHVTEDAVIDFKTVFSSQFKVMKGMMKDQIIQDKLTYVLQILCYCHFLKKPTGILVFVNKDDYDIIQVDIDYEENKHLIEKELEALLSIKELPKAEPRAYVNKKTGKSVEGNYCNYRTKCKELGWDCSKLKEVENVKEE